MAFVSYRRPPADHTDRADQDLHVYVSAFFVDAFSCHNRGLVQVTDDSPVFAMRGAHFLPTIAKLHHFPSTLLRPSHLIHIGLVHCAKLY